MKKFIPLVAVVMLAAPIPARADFFGTDILIMSQILAQAVQTVVQLKSILSTGSDTLDLLRDVNSGLNQGINLLRQQYPQFDPGVFGSLKDPRQALRALESVYGEIPQGPDQTLLRSQDQSVAESIAMNQNLYSFANEVDQERNQILYHASLVSPQGAGKLENQALAVLISVTNELLRTQNQMLKLMAENLAIQNRKEKFESQEVQENYSTLSSGLKSLPQKLTLPVIQGGAK